MAESRLKTTNNIQTSLYGANTNWNMMMRPINVGWVSKPKAEYRIVFFISAANTKKHRNKLTCK